MEENKENLEDQQGSDYLACGPKPPPKLTAGGWKCENGEWVWIEDNG